jgi:hypothetical protein
MKFLLKPFDKPREYWQKSHIHVFENQSQEEFDHFVLENRIPEIGGIKINSYVFNHSQKLENVAFQGNEWFLFKLALRASFIERFLLFGGEKRDYTFEEMNASLAPTNKLAIDVYYLRVTDQLDMFESSCIQQIAHEFASNYGVFIIISLATQKSPDHFIGIDRRNYYKGWKENRS